MFRFSISARAGLGAFVREFLEAHSGARREFGAFETREIAALPLPASEQATEPQPAAPVEVVARRGGRLIDLERRAKFGQFVS